MVLHLHAGLTCAFIVHSLLVKCLCPSPLHHFVVDEQLIMERTCHRNLVGVHLFKMTSKNQRQPILLA